MTRRVAAMLCAIALPPLVVTVVVIAESARERLSPLDDGGPVNSAEAAAGGNAAVLLRFLAQGDDPTRVHALRPSYISSSVVAATTLEAAMWSRQLEMIRLLDRQGVIVGDDQRLFLACLASDLGSQEIARYLVPVGRACVEGEARAKVLERTSGPAVPAR